jgi:hypothetical protein
MSYQNNLHYFNIAIEDYSISELYNLLELDEFTRENILLKVHDLTSNIFKNNEPIKQFFLKAQNKLLNHLSNNNTHNNILDNFLHTNANSNIEVNQNYINNIAYEDDDDEDDEDDIEDNNTNDANDNVYIKDTNTNANTNANTNVNTNVNANVETIETNGNIKESYVDYSKYKPTETTTGTIIEKYDLYKNLYFNTFFRLDKNVVNSLSTDCKIQLTNSLNNVIQCKLTAINIRKPFLIHTTKANDTFIIKKYINIFTQTTRQFTVDFSYVITIDKGYYEDFTEMETFINNKFQNFTYTLSGNILNYKTTNRDISNRDMSNSDFINALSFTINKNTKQTMFDLSKSFIDGSYASNFKHYEIDFKTNYSTPYSLATILGFDFETNPDTSYNLKNNYQIISPKTYCLLNNPIFFCFRENISTVIETHQLFLKNNISSDKILAKINTHKGTTLNNYYIYEILDNIDNKNNIRKYNGPIHLSDFNIKIIDHFGNLVQSIDEEFTFELEVIIQETKFQQTIV